MAIVESWFQPQGRLANVWALDNIARSLFGSVLPVAPEAGLEAIERDLPPREGAGKLKGWGYLCGALRALAYDASLFDRCVAVLARLARDGDEAVAKEALGTLLSLFHLYLSGTHAPIEQRVAVVRRWLAAPDQETRALGQKAFEALLEGDHFRGHHEFQFGARSRDYGIHPRTGADVTHWFRSVFSLFDDERDHTVAQAMRTALADQFRGIWSQVWARGDLEVLERNPISLHRILRRRSSWRTLSA